ncbi:MAG TPA: phosphoribosylaminoimidazolesuccinocarboxamide synthase [Holophaga sp.]|nr:phosphoribosylaminoimidazolesuccinocarboxamide synthase [Holophaga sp.]
MRIPDSRHQPHLALPFPLLRSEPDRRIFDLGELVLIVADDSVSSHGQLLGGVIPFKGRILSHLAGFWFEATRDLVPNPLLAPEACGIPGPLLPYWERLANRCSVLRKVEPCQVKCAVHGYLTGSAYEEYATRGSVCGMQLPPRLHKGARLRGPLFAPYVDEVDGRRRNIPMSEMMDMVGIKAVQQLKESSLALYMRGYHLAWERGILLADARFGFGWMENRTLILADQVLTPSLSRYWSMEDWKPGTAPPRMDRRELLGYLHAELGWDGTLPAPGLPDRVVEAIGSNYLELARRFGMTGQALRELPVHAPDPRPFRNILVQEPS